MLDALVEDATAAGIHTLQGYYIPTKKNSMVADHYLKLGFDPALTDGMTNGSIWRLSVSGYSPRNRHIRVSRA
jgi:predicted enzyme involved in methoxymalonyl-ACP biosynthesis